MDGLEGFAEIFPGVFYREGASQSEVRIMGVRLDLPPPEDRQSVFSEAVKDKLLPLLDRWYQLYGPLLIQYTALEVSREVARHFRLIQPPDWEFHCSGTNVAAFCGVKLLEVEAGGPLVQLVSRLPGYATRLEVIVPNLTQLVENARARESADDVEANPR